ncbi:MAG: 1-acyl-sn-glycerol-3-phosphate acyltransferase [Clostridiales bacterium]|nr:1-acyl-sn-glycerol-3-phosphate acyltransferase [Clostridiales bacterium]
MKVKSRKVDGDYILSLPRVKRKKAPYPSFIFRTLVRILSIGELKKVDFSYKQERMDLIGKKQPILILMNHSSFIDLKIASKIFYPRCYNIIGTADAMIGKEWLMRRLGVVATNKFVPDIPLVLECMKIAKKKKRSILLYPEAGYSFDGTATALPKSLAPFIKSLGIPVVTVITDGAFLYDPLYNELKKRKVKVSAKVKCLFTAEELNEKSVEEIETAVKGDFSFDNFKNQYLNGVKITEPNRADGLQRVLYKCPACGGEETQGKGENLTCLKCGKTYRLEENGQMKALIGETEFPHIPDWYNWEREEVKKEILSGNYNLETKVDYGVISGYKSFFEVGEGILTHNSDGLKLVSLDGKITASQSAKNSYSINADFYWYEGGDIVSLGNSEILYYCFPKENIPVAKIRLAGEETYKLLKKEEKK